MPKTTQAEAQRDLVTRWGGKASLFDKGWLGVPTAFLRYLGKLDPPLTPAEAVFVLELMAFKWGSKAPFPGYKTIASRMGVSQVYARKLARSLEEKQYLQREMRVGQTNRFRLSGLFDELERVVTQIGDQEDEPDAEESASPGKGPKLDGTADITTDRDGNRDAVTHEPDVT